MYHTHIDTNAGVTSSLVSPGDTSNVTIKTKRRKRRREEKVKDAFWCIQFKVGAGAGRYNVHLFVYYTL